MASALVKKPADLTTIAKRNAASSLNRANRTAS
jgi:hypothetical protein